MVRCTNKKRFVLYVRMYIVRYWYWKKHQSDLDWRLRTVACSWHFHNDHCTNKKCCKALLLQEQKHLTSIANCQEGRAEINFHMKWLFCQNSSLDVQILDCDGSFHFLSSFVGCKIDILIQLENVVNETCGRKRCE